MELAPKNISGALKGFNSEQTTCTMCGLESVATGVILIPEEDYLKIYCLCWNCLYSELHNILDELFVQQVEEKNSFQL